MLRSVILTPLSKTAASSQWASFGTFPLGRIGKAIAFHASGITRWWHKPVGGRQTVWRIWQPLVLPLPELRGNIILCHPIWP